jgi:choline dehydrogenase-like flavoprotein
MGTDPATSVIAPSGESHRVPNLFISDASVFPTSLGVNPQLTTMTVGTEIGRRMVRV